MTYEPRFLQIHTLTSYPGVLLNRDDAGFAKRLNFGGATRTRVSSQCLKRHWRTHTGEHSLESLEVPRSVRSRQTFEALIAAPLREGSPAALVDAVVIELMTKVLGKSAASKDKADTIKTNQITVLGRPEVDYMRAVVDEVLVVLREQEGELWAAAGAFGDDDELDKAQTKTIADTVKAHLGKDLKKSLHGLKLAAGLDAALFGRMVTSDVLARGDAAIHVAHALTVHEEASETDYFTAVDDLIAQEGDGELGSGHINTAELTSGLYYGYVVIDYPLLVSNLEGVPQAQWREAEQLLAGRVVEQLIHLITTVSPGAKRGSTSPHSWAECLLVEVGRSQPCTLANAFRRPVASRPDVLANAYGALARHIEDLDGMYDTGVTRRAALRGEGREHVMAAIGQQERASTADVARWASDALGGS